MWRSWKWVLGVALSAVTVAAAAQMAAPRDAQVVLTQQKVTRAADGQERLVAVDQAVPGDVVEYRATYHNRSQAAQRNVALTVPVPAGMQLAGSVRPAGAMATIDNKRFEAMPLRRKVRAADGREIEQVVPASEYKALRWNVGEVGAGKSADVAARMQLNPTDGQVAVVK